MSHKAEIIMGLEDLRSVRAYRFLPGLCVHRTPGCPPGEDFLNITYERTGLAIVTYLHPASVGTVKAILTVADWTLGPDIVLKSAVHRQAHEASMKLSNHKKSARQETRIAKETGGKRQPASGSRPGYKRDILLPEFLVEAKTTDKDVFYLDTKDLAFLRKQAYTVGKTPAYIVAIKDDQELVVLPAQDMDDDLLVGATMKKRSWAGKANAPLTAAMADEAQDNVVYDLELAVGRFFCVSYERFLNIAKRGLDED